MDGNGQHESRITCVVADDHPVIVDALGRQLTAAGIEVLASAETADEALRAIREFKPDVAVIDVGLPDGSGIELTRVATRLQLPTRIVLYTAVAEPALLREGFDAGAQGFVLKTSPPAEVTRAAKAVAAGQVYADPLLAGSMIGRAHANEPQLSAREREVLRLLADGRTTKEIAASMFIAPDTVRTHIQNAMKHLGVRSRAEAVASALRASLIR